MWSCKRFYVYLYIADFDLLTDHKALEFIFSSRSSLVGESNPNPLLRFQPYRYKVIDIAGSKNISDSLSRLFNKNMIKNTRNDGSDCENYVQNDVNTKCLRPPEILKQNVLIVEYCF